MDLESKKEKKQVISISLMLRKSVFFSPIFSQMYNREKDEYHIKNNLYLFFPNRKYGSKHKILHFHHFALFNDALAFRCYYKLFS